MDVTFDGSELNRLGIDLGKAGLGVVPKAALAIRKTASDIEASAKTIVPVDTGNLKNSISTSALGLAAEIGPTADYGVYVEFGTSTQGPAAFMGPAFDRHAYQLEAALLKLAADI